MAEPVKQRLLVMNGQRLLQTAQAGSWATSKVDRAGTLKPGIYDLHLSKIADKSKGYDGPMLFADSASVYQKAGKDIVKHDRASFAKLPEPGADFSVRYDGENVLVTATTVSLVRGRSR